MTLICQVFRSQRREEMYLYVDKSRGICDVPETLMEQFGEPHPVMVLELSSDRQLARAEAGEVIASIQEQGYYLQMPPSFEELSRRDQTRE